MKVLERKFIESKVKKEFRQALWIYDLWARLTERTTLRISLQLADIRNGDAVLDMGCGTGELLEKIARINPGGKNIGIDLSPDMLKRAEKRLTKRHKGDFELQEGNALSANFPDDTFDIVFNNFMVDLMPVETFDQIAAEFYRVLKPGGTMVLSSFSFGTKKIHRFWYWIAKWFPGLLTGCRPVSFKNYLQKAGFDIEVDMEISQNTFPSQIIKGIKRNKTDEM